MRPWVRGLAGAALLLAVVQGSGLGDGLQRWLTDQHWRWRASIVRPKFPPEVMVVAIDDRTLQAYGRLRYWSRDRYGKLLQKLSQADAVGFDILFDEPDQDPRGDAAFAAAVEKHGRVVIPFHRWREAQPYNNETDRRLVALMQRLPSLDHGAGLPVVYPQSIQTPLPELVSAAAALGTVDLTSDPDGVYRSPALLQRTPDQRIIPHFALAVASVALKSDPKELLVPAPSGVRLQGEVVPLDDGYITLEPMAHRPGGRATDPGTAVPTVSFVEAMEKLPPEEFAGKIVLVGETATGTTDIRPTALDSGLRGVELNAEVLSNLLTGRTASTVPPIAQWALVACAVLLPIWFYSVLPTRRAVLASAAVALGCFAAMEALFWAVRAVPTWSPVLFGVLGSTLAMALPRLAEEEAARRQLRGLFSLYVAPEVVDEIVQTPSLQSVKATRQRVAALFSDVRGFTTYSESHPPEQVGEQMSEYLTSMTEAVLGVRGFLDKFIGDAVMALFGPYLSEENPNLSAKAVVCALDMLRRLEEINSQWESKGWPPFQIGIGIHVGEAVVGDFSAGTRHQMTALGDTVNLAARLESATKELKASLLISEATKEEAAPLLERYVTFIDRGVITVKGREQPVRVYEVLARESAATGSPNETGPNAR